MLWLLHESWLGSSANSSVRFRIISDFKQNKICSILYELLWSLNILSFGTTGHQLSMIVTTETLFLVQKYGCVHSHTYPNSGDRPSPKLNFTQCEDANMLCRVVPMDDIHILILGYYCCSVKGKRHTVLSLHRSRIDFTAP